MLSYEYQQGLDGFQKSLCVFSSHKSIASALEGLITSEQVLFGCILALYSVYIDHSYGCKMYSILRGSSLNVQFPYSRGSLY